MSAAAATCSQHAMREAVGICVRCKSPMCSDCITKIDGINHCRSCLEQLTRKAGAEPVKKSIQIPTWLALGFGIATLTAMAWVALEAVMPGGTGP